MSDEKPKASGIQKVAEEAFTPAAKEFGQEIAPLGKATGALTNRVGQLLLMPFSGLVYGLEKSAEYIKRAVTERLKDVPQDKIVEPQARIAVPAMQALTYSVEEQHIREMFANLLAADMNADTKGDVHPAFVELIKEMTPIEAKVLLALKDGSQIEGSIRFGKPFEEFLNHSRTYTFRIEGIHPNAYPKSLDNLDRLGLIDFKDEYPSTFKEWEEKLKEYSKHLFEGELNPQCKALADRLPGSSGLVDFRGIYLTDLGKAFVNICMKGFK